LDHVEEGWERPPRVELSEAELQHLIRPAFPGDRIIEHRVVSTGLANTNVHFWLDSYEQSFVLRLHTREPKAAVKERDLMRFLASHPHPPIPVAPLIYSDVAPERGGHPYSIWQFVPGTLLQNLFSTLPSAELVQIARVCGQVAAGLSAHSFSSCGELGSNLKVVEEYGAPSRFIPALVHSALSDGLAGQRLGKPLSDALWHAVERRRSWLQELDGRYSLVHADYKRSNLLLARAGESWAVTAVLDWEFAFAGPPLVDVGLFLRAGDALPSGFREAFAAGYREAGGVLPAEWLRLSRLVDLLSQITFLNDSRDRPRIVAETTRVVQETVRMLG
jgi:aminoglycoside phosphotransferase (APT) family kinase protein